VSSSRRSDSQKHDVFRDGSPSERTNPAPSSRVAWVAHATHHAIMGRMRDQDQRARCDVPEAEIHVAPEASAQIDGAIFGNGQGPAHGWEVSLWNCPRRWRWG
jgi:hypothetical protein